MTCVGDVTNKEQCSHFLKNASNAILIHIAGVIHPKKVTEFYDVNVKGTQNILTQAINNNIKRSVVISSNSPIGCNADHQSLFDETSPYNPYMNYGRSKMLMEKNIKKMQTKSDVDIVIIRPPWFYGPGQPKRQTLFFSLIKQGRFPLVGTGTNQRSMVYIENLCQGILLAALIEKAKNNIYWIADQNPYQMKDIITTIQDVLEQEFNLKVKRSIKKFPSMIADIAQYCDYFLQKLNLYHQKIHVLSEMNKSIACSIEKARTELNYNPTVSLRQGMRDSIQYCMNQGISI